MRRKFNHPKLKFFLGDVREQNSLIEPVRDSNFIFHAAALKQVPSCEFHPMEAVKTNVLGTENLLNAAIQERVKKSFVSAQIKQFTQLMRWGHLKQ